MVVTWVEDRKIRQYDIEQGSELRAGGNQWSTAFQQYLLDLESPHAWSSIDREQKVRALRWLVTKALAYDYEDEGMSRLNM